LKVVRLLLDHNADVHMGNNSGDTPLHVAASYGSLEVAGILLECKVEVNSRNHDGSTPLHFASSSGHPNVVQLFLDYDADEELAARVVRYV